MMKIEEPLEERRSCGQRLLTYKVLRGPPPSCPEELTASLPGYPPGLPELVYCWLSRTGAEPSAIRPPAENQVPVQV